MNLGSGYMLRTLLKTLFPALEYNLRKKSRIHRRDIIQAELLEHVQNDLVTLYKYDNMYDVWRESLYGVHLPHLVHYDDRNAMANSIEGRMPFLDHRIVEYIARIRPDDFLKRGMRKFILRESCKDYLPDIIYNRKDKIGFYTPLVNMLDTDAEWVRSQLSGNNVLKAEHTSELLRKLDAKKLEVNEALQIWRSISVNIWKEQYHVKS